MKNKFIEAEYKDFNISNIDISKCNYEQLVNIRDMLQDFDESVRVEQEIFERAYSSSIGYKKEHYKARKIKEKQRKAKFKNCKEIKRRDY